MKLVVVGLFMMHSVILQLVIIVCAMGFPVAVTVALGILGVLMILAFVLFGACFVRMGSTRRAIGKKSHLRPGEWESELLSPMLAPERAWLLAYIGGILFLSIALVIVHTPACGMFFVNFPLVVLAGYAYVCACYADRNRTLSSLGKCKTPNLSASQRTKSKSPRIRFLARLFPRND